MRCALYARVSTNDQTCETQLRQLREYAAARGWTVHAEYVDQGISGLRESRPGLDSLLRDAKRRRFSAICVFSLCRIGRSLKNLITVLDEIHALGIAFVSIHEGLDLSTPAGRLQWQIIGAISEFERNRIAERVRAGLQRVKAEGRRLGRPSKEVDPALLAPVRGLPVREAARRLGVSRATAHRWLSQKTSAPAAPKGLGNLRKSGTRVS